MKDLFNLTKDKEEREHKARVDFNQKIALEFFNQLKEKNLQVQDAVLVVKFLQDQIQGLSGKKIQTMYLNHL